MLELRVTHVQKVPLPEHGLAAPEYLGVLPERQDQFVYVNGRQQLVSKDHARAIIASWGDFHVPERPVRHAINDRLFYDHAGEVVLDSPNCPYLAWEG